MDVYMCVCVLGFCSGSVVKNPPAMQEPKETRVKSLRRLPGGGHGSPLQYSCLENPMDRGAEEPGGLQSIVLDRVGHD